MLLFFQMDPFSVRRVVEIRAVVMMGEGAVLRLVGVMMAVITITTIITTRALELVHQEPSFLDLCMFQSILILQVE